MKTVCILKENNFAHTLFQAFESFFRKSGGGESIKEREMIFKNGNRSFSHGANAFCSMHLPEAHQILHGRESKKVVFGKVPF